MTGQQLWALSKIQERRAPDSGGGPGDQVMATCITIKPSRETKDAKIRTTTGQGMIELGESKRKEPEEYLELARSDEMSCIRYLA